MKIGEIINKVDKSEKNSSWIDFERLGREFGLSVFLYKENTKLKSYFFVNWFCTDTWVGGRVYFLDDELVAASTQPGRKCDETIYWASKEAFKKTRAYLLTLIDDDGGDEVQLIDMEAEWGNGHEITFSEELLTNTVILADTNERVEIVEKYPRSTNWAERSVIKIKRSNGNIERIDMKAVKVLVPYNLI